jgi:anti-anti-sigma factor
MELTHISSRGFDAFTLKGKLVISSLLSLTTALSRHVQEHPDKDLALEMSGVERIDSSGLRLVINLKKRLEALHHDLYIVAPSPAVTELFGQTNLTAILTVIDSLEQIQRRKATDVFEVCRRFAADTDGWLSLRCSCPVCGSPHVSAYLIETGAYRWGWEGVEAFPTAFAPESEQPVEVFGHLPLVCLDCYMASTDVSDFNVLEGEQIARRSMMRDTAKSLLGKSMKKRKKLMEIGVAIGDRFFEHPRDRRACYQAFLLAATCARTLAMDRKRAHPFTIGYLNYLALRFAPESAAHEHLGNCRTWLTQALSTPQSLTPTETAIAHFALFSVTRQLAKTKEASQLYTTFARFIEQHPPAETDESITNPRFWFSQAERIWHTDIEGKSRELRLHG